MDFLPQTGIIALLANATTVVKLILLLLASMSLTSWTIIFTKIFMLSSAKKRSIAGFGIFQSASDLASALKTMSQGAESPVFRIGYQGVMELKRMEKATLRPEIKSRIAMDNLRRTLRQAISTQLRTLSSNLPFLATCANAAPFIGLFGTVWGIMHSFHEIGMQKSASLQTVAPGISEALIATAIGLAVAIPATIAYNFFLGTLTSIETELINFSGEFLNRVQREVSWIARGGEHRSAHDDQYED